MSDFIEITFPQPPETPVLSREQKALDRIARLKTASWSNKAKRSWLREFYRGVVAVQHQQSVPAEGMQDVEKAISLYREAFELYKENAKSSEQTLLDFSVWLSDHHPSYTIDEVRPTDVKGFLKSIKPCTCTNPPFDGYTVGYLSGKESAHCHTLELYGTYRKGYGRGPLAFWRAVCEALAEKFSH